MKNHLIRLNVKYILPVTEPPIQDGSILIKNKKITFVGGKNDCPDDPPDQVLDFSEHLLMPGLVNSHTHLSLTKLKNKIQPGISFPDWIKKIVSYTSAMSESEEKEAIKEGLSCLIETGTTTIGDISRSGNSINVMRSMKIGGIVYLEVIGFKKSAMNDQINRVNQILKDNKADEMVEFGLSPHSPYSVSPQLIESTYRLAQSNRLQIAMHIAETKEESEFIEKGEGRLRSLMEEMDRWEPDWKVSKSTPIKYLNNLGALKDMTGIHLNYIDDEDIDIMKENNLSIVYCPKSNKWFHRGESYPLIKYLKKNINVSVGTDSLASNDSLNMFEEMSLIKKQFPSLSDETIVQMATINGAKALGMEKITGSLETGKKADIIALKLNGERDIYKSIFFSEGKIDFSMIAGEIIISSKK